MATQTNRLRRTLMGGALGVSLLMSGYPAQAQSFGSPAAGDVQYRRAYNPVTKTVHDLRSIYHIDGAYSGRQQQRYGNALRHLDEYGARMQNGWYDKGKLDQAIGDVQHLVDNNPVDPRARNVLYRDLADLRSMRAAMDHRGYRGW